MGDIPERQLRPLAKLEPEQQREAWKKAIETAPDGKVTAKHITEVVMEVTGEKEIVYQDSKDMQGSNVRFCKVLT